MPEQRLAKCRESYREDGTGKDDDGAEAGWCPTCGYFAHRGEPVCPDGTRVVDDSLAGDERDLWGV